MKSSKALNEIPTELDVSASQSTKICDVSPAILFNSSEAQPEVQPVVQPVVQPEVQSEVELEDQQMATQPEFEPQVQLMAAQSIDQPEAIQPEVEPEVQLMETQPEVEPVIGAPEKIQSPRINVNGRDFLPLGTLQGRHTVVPGEPLPKVISVNDQKYIEVIPKSDMDVELQLGKPFMDYLRTKSQKFRLEAGPSLVQLFEVITTLKATSSAHPQDFGKLCDLLTWARGESTFAKEGKLRSYDPSCLLEVDSWNDQKTPYARPSLLQKLTLAGPTGNQILTDLFCLLPQFQAQLVNGEAPKIGRSIGFYFTTTVFTVKPSASGSSKKRL